MMLFKNKELNNQFNNVHKTSQSLDYQKFTPMLVYSALGGSGSAMMESAYDEGYGTYSFIGVNPLATLRAKGLEIEIEYADQKEYITADPYLILPEFTNLRRAFGFITYDGVRVKEVLPDRHVHKNIPDFFFRVYRTIVCFDHILSKLVIHHEGTEEELAKIIQKLQAITIVPAAETIVMDKMLPDVDDEAYANSVIKAKEYIKHGDIFQVVLSRTFSAHTEVKPFTLYRAFRKLNPTPYLYLFEEPEFAIIGASPELLVGVKDGEIETVPIAGTCKKGDDVNDLLNDPKETAEHVMLVDLARNDIGAMSKAGSVQVTKFKDVKTYSHVSHIVSNVVSQLDTQYNAFDVVKSTLPAGTLSGAPKIRAMEIIDELEYTRRGLYGGAVMMVDEQANLTAAIAIRTLFMQNKKLELRVGAGIVYDSIPEKEVQETYLKARGGMASIELACGGSI
jgi:anthranilate synthase component 1